MHIHWQKLISETLFEVHLLQGNIFQNSYKRDHIEHFAIYYPEIIYQFFYFLETIFRSCIHSSIWLVVLDLCYTEPKVCVRNMFALLPFNLFKTLFSLVIKKNTFSKNKKKLKKYILIVKTTNINKACEIEIENIQASKLVTIM